PNLHEPSFEPLCRGRPSCSLLGALPAAAPSTSLPCWSPLPTDWGRSDRRCTGQRSWKIGLGTNNGARRKCALWAIFDRIGPNPESANAFDTVLWIPGSRAVPAPRNDRGSAGTGGPVRPLSSSALAGEDAWLPQLHTHAPTRRPSLPPSSRRISRRGSTGCRG